MAKYRIYRVKPKSPLKRYEYLRSKGILMETGGSHPTLVRGEALDKYVDEALWREANPGQEPYQEWDDGLPAK